MNELNNKSRSVWSAPAKEDVAKEARDNPDFAKNRKFLLIVLVVWVSLYAIDRILSFSPEHSIGFFLTPLLMAGIAVASYRSGNRSIAIIPLMFFLFNTYNLVMLIVDYGPPIPNIYSVALIMSLFAHLAVAVLLFAHPGIKRYSQTMKELRIGKVKFYS